jgi:transposase-like protein
MTAPIYSIEPKAEGQRNWLLKSELASLFGIHRKTLWKWLKKAEAISPIEGLSQTGHRLYLPEIEIICERLAYSPELAYEAMNIENRIQKVQI